jgi:hypothetical protein
MSNPQSNYTTKLDSPLIERVAKVIALTAGSSISPQQWKQEARAAVRQVVNFLYENDCQDVAEWLDIVSER